MQPLTCVGALEPTCWPCVHLNKKTRMRELNLQDQQQSSLVGIRFASENGASEPTWMKDECAEEVRNG